MSGVVVSALIGVGAVILGLLIIYLTPEKPGSARDTARDSTPSGGFSHRGGQQ